MGAVVSDGGTLFVYGGQGGAALLRVSASPKPRLTAHSQPSISYRDAHHPSSTVSSSTRRACSSPVLCQPLLPVRERILPPPLNSARGGRTSGAQATGRTGPW